MKKRNKDEFEHSYYHAFLMILKKKQSDITVGEANFISLASEVYLNEFMEAVLDSLGFEHEHQED